jgi:ZIP family zinc transporter
METIFQVAIWGIMGSVALVLGASIGYYFKIPKKILAATTAFSAGILISAVCFELLFEAYAYGGAEPTVTGFVIGVVAFTLVDVIINHFAIKKHQKNQSNTFNNYNIDTDSSFGNSNINENINENINGNINGNIERNSCNIANKGIYGCFQNVYHHRYRLSFNKYHVESFVTVAGAMLDGIPEALAIGLVLIIGGPISLAMIIAVFVANTLEGASSAVNMKLGGWKKGSIFGVWIMVTALSAISAVIGFSMFSHTDHHILSGALAVAAGALLSMIADVLLPEAFNETHEFTGLLMALGFLFSFILSHLK